MNKMNSAAKREGFTLLELLIVIAIIGILAGITLASVSAARTNAKVSSVKQSINEFNKIMQLEFLNNSSYRGVWIDGSFGWVKPGQEDAKCNYFSAVDTNVADLCRSIFTKSEEFQNNNGEVFYTGSRIIDSSAPGDKFVGEDTFIIRAALPGNNFFCRNDLGQVTDNTNKGDGACAQVDIAP